MAEPHAGPYERRPTALRHGEGQPADPGDHAVLHRGVAHRGVIHAGEGDGALRVDLEAHGDPAREPRVTDELVLVAVLELAVVGVDHAADELAIVPGKYVYEIKHARFSKGTAVAEFMSRPPWAGRRPVFIGDDVTDEAAFAVLPRWNGEGLAVGQDRPGARARFANAAEVRQWLASLVGQECTS